MIVCTNLSKIYQVKQKEVRSLDDINVTINDGEFVTLRGPSGCGKSTLLLTIGGMIKPTTGTVTVNDQNIYQISSDERAAFREKEIGFIFQAFHLIPYLNIFENILSSNLRNDPTLVKRANELLDRFHLTERKKHKPSELSTGEKQRVALARAFLKSPRIILADEPTGNLDGENSTIVLDHLKEYQKGGATIILVTHQNNYEKYTDRVLNMVAGKFSI